ncbi:MAG: hypothetical protein A2Y41_00105 [Spirochaetes bacterium GWB1_36_13]|nr:MAG: hypothetical protein A2Y41_00105 [Spirochaetes bacterium GWB1_36_13]
MKHRFIKRFRFTRVIFFTLKILLRYISLFFIRHFVPNFVYSKILKSVNLATSKKIRNYFFRLQGTYIKVGQFLSVIGNIFAPEITKYLKDLQDKVPPRPFQEILPTFLHEWGASPFEILEDFNFVPIASASLGQVYTANYKGEKVAVKVLYPEIKQIIEKDLNILKSVLGLIEFFFPGLDYGILYNEFADMILKEIDFNYEKTNIKRLRQLFSEEPDVIIPKYIDELSIGNILVTQFIEGCKIDEIDKMKEYRLDSKEIAKNLLDVYFKMIFKHGFFHSDPHPGNLIVTPEGKLGIIDFGSADTISNDNITLIRKVLRAFLFKDLSMLVQHIEEIGFLKPSADKEEIEKIAYFFLQRMSAFEVKDYQRMTLNEIYKIYNLKIIGVKFQQLLKHLQIPRNYLFLGRTITILVGVVSKLDPEINILNLMIPHLRKFLLGKTEGLKSMLKEDLKKNIHYISQLPENVHKTMETINSGKIRVNLKEMKQEIRKIYVLGHQFIYTLLLIMLGSFSLIFHLNDKQGFSQIFAGGSFFFGFILLVSFIRNRKT